MVNPVNNILKIDFADLTNLKTQLESFREDVKFQNPQKNAQEGTKQEKLQSTDAQEKSKINFEEIGQQLKEFLGVNNVTIEFSLDSSSSKMVMKIIDNNTKEVVKQFPPDLSLQIARIVSSSMLGKGFTDVRV